MALKGVKQKQIIKHFILVDEITDWERLGLLPLESNKNLFPSVGDGGLLRLIKSNI